jgi:hypothetical protein
LGRTVEKYSKTKHKERNHKSTSLNPCFIGRNWVGLLKKYLRPNVKKGITKEQHTTNSAHIGRFGRTVEKYFS